MKQLKDVGSEFGQCLAVNIPSPRAQNAETHGLLTIHDTGAGIM